MTSQPPRDPDDRVLEGRLTDRLCVVTLRVATPEGWKTGKTADEPRTPPARFEDVRAVIDTGAMLSAIPVEVLDRLRCPAFGAVRFQSVLGPHDKGDQVVGSYAACLALPGVIQLTWARVLGVRLDTALLGMDVLEHLHLEVDGPAGTFRLRARD